MRTDSHLLANCLLAIALTALAACGGGRSSFAPQPGGNGPAMVNLPSPLELSSRLASFTELGLMREGSDFDAGLPNNLVTANGTDADFAPTFGSAKSAANLAFAVYGFDVSAYDRDLNVRLTWATAPATGECFVALANFTTNKWVWQALPATNVLDFTGLNDFTSPATQNLYAAVMLTGSAPATLDRLRVGTQPTPGNPNADLQATPMNGPAPLDVAFDASASSAAPPATIVKYEFDFGDGAGFQDMGATATANHQYAANGSFNAMLRVTDVFGATDTASVTIDVGASTYSEVEDNDTRVTANALPAFPFTSWTGSFSSGPGHPGYDGDFDDFFSFNAAPGDTVLFTLNHDPANGDFVVELLDANDTGLALGFSTGGVLTLQYALAPGDTAPFAFHILDPGGFGFFGDYTLAAVVNPPTAALIATPSAGAAPLDVVLDASGSSDLPPGTIQTYEFDPEGDGTFLAAQPTPTLNFQYTVDGVYIPAVVVTDNEGNTATATASVLVGDLYDEVENNDTMATQNFLPNLPFSGFRGNAGAGGVYDGDSDYLGFSALDGDTVSFTITCGLTMDISLGMLDADGDPLGFAADTMGTGSATITYSFAPGDTAPFSLFVDGYSGNGDYLLSGLMNPPTAVIGAAPSIGPVPLDVFLDASASTDTPPGSIVTWEFDPEGDGTFDVPQGGSGYNFQYTVDGVYNPTVRVTDDEGNTAIASTSVMAGDLYDEVEDNDDIATANVLPALPVTGFRGNCGNLGIYDGDQDDFFSFPASPGDIVQAAVTGTDIDFMIEILASDGTQLAEGYTWQDGATITATIGAEPGPFVLHVFAFNDADYLTSVMLNPPTADLIATPPSGPIPLDVVLDASGSTDVPPGTIATYEFDPEGDGTFDVPQPGPTYPFQYTTDGFYAATVRVTDDEGNTATASTTVQVGANPYDEVEDNDAYTSPNALPSFPFNGFAGSHSTGVGYPGYDGDTDDYFGFSGTAGQSVSFTLTYDNTNGEMSIDLYDGAGNDITWDDGNGGTASLTYVLGSDGLDTGGPYSIRIWDVNDGFPGAHFGDYSLDGSIT